MRDGSISLARSVAVAIMVSTGCVGCGGPDLGSYHPIAQIPKPANTSEADQEIEKKDVRPVIQEKRESQRRLESLSDQPPAVSDANTSSVQEKISAKTLLAEELLPVSALVPVNVIDGTNVARLLNISSEAASDAVVIKNGPRPAVNEKPRTVELLIPEKTFQTDPQSKALRVSYDDLDLLKVLNMEPVVANAAELMPDWLKNLSGQRIKLRGFMFPSFESEGIERFVLARDNQICCFGREAKVYDLVQIDMKKGKTTNYIPPTRSFDVVGRFKIEMLSDDGKPYGLYFIEDAQIIDR